MLEAEIPSDFHNESIRLIHTKCPKALNSKIKKDTNQLDIFGSMVNIALSVVVFSKLFFYIYGNLPQRGRILFFFLIRTRPKMPCAVHGTVLIGWGRVGGRMK